MTLLQRIQLINTGPVSQNAYFSAADADVKTLSLHDTLTLRKGDRVDFCTYFNILNIDKWRSYTKATSVVLRLRIKGKVRVNLLNLINKGGEATKQIVKTKVFTKETEGEIELQFPEDINGVLGFELIAIEESMFSSGGYYSPIGESELQDIKLALCICTYKREPFVEQNLATIEDLILNDPENPVHNNLQVYISDNGNSLDSKRLSSSKIQIFPNQNTGGAGGFSRAVLEASSDANYTPTHCILADDDAVINFSSIERTYLFLRALKSKFYSAMIGGSLWSLSRPSLVFASGELRTSDWSHSNPKRGLDILSLEDILKLEADDPINYFGWWYCVAPISLFKNSLAIPIFFQYDDVEFSLRNSKSAKITLPGVGLWHEELDIKYTAAKKYYWFRNESIVRALYGVDSTTGKYAAWVLKDIFNSVLVYSYDDAVMTIRAIRDFIKGPSWLMHVDQEALNKNILSSFTPLSPAEDLPVKINIDRFHNDLQFGESRKKTLARKLLLNGLLLPAHKYSAEDIPVVKFEYPHPALLFRQPKALRYNEFTKQGVFVERKVSKSLSLLWSGVVLYITILIKYPSLARKYKSAHSEMISEKFWRNKLGI